MRLIEEVDGEEGVDGGGGVRGSQGGCSGGRVTLGTHDGAGTGDC